MMPRNLVVVRHGESEGNFANRLSRKGDNSVFSEEFRNRPGAYWRLTERGVDQAQKAGAWLRAEFPQGFGRAYSSEYIRAMETSYNLDIGAPYWYLDPQLREQDWGILDVMPDDERREQFHREVKWKTVNPFFWAPPGGESIAHVQMRVDRILQTLHRECSKMDVVIVCHGNVMWALRSKIERMSQVRFLELDASEHPYDHIHNCQVLHYSRVNPETQEEESYLNWLRSVCPSDLTLSRNTWEKVIRPKFSRDDLRDMVERVPRIPHPQKAA